MVFKVIPNLFKRLRCVPIQQSDYNSHITEYAGVQCYEDYNPYKPFSLSLQCGEGMVDHPAQKLNLVYWIVYGSFCFITSQQDIQQTFHWPKHPNTSKISYSWTQLSYNIFAISSPIIHIMSQLQFTSFSQISFASFHWACQSHSGENPGA